MRSNEKRTIQQNGGGKWDKNITGSPWVVLKGSARGVGTRLSYAVSDERQIIITTSTSSVRKGNGVGQGAFLYTVGWKTSDGADERDLPDDMADARFKTDH